MRKQYYFRQSEHGLLAWDVDHLVQLATHLSHREARVDSIKEIDESHWFDSDTLPTCRAIVEHAKLIEEADMKFPIILSYDGRVMDGMHRVCKALMKDLNTIESVQFEQEIEPDYVDCNPDELPY